MPESEAAAATATATATTESHTLFVLRYGWREGNDRRDSEIALESADDEWVREWP